MNLASWLNFVFQPIGMAGAILVLLSILTLAFINSQLANRMTVRLIAAIAFADLFTHAGEYYAASNVDLALGTPSCTAVSVFRSFSRTFYCFTNFAICYHLYRSLVQLKKSTWKFEVYVWIATIAMTLIFIGIYAGLGVFSGTTRRSGCNPSSDSKVLNTVYFILTGLIDLTVVAVGVFTTIKGRQNLNKWINAYSATLTESGDHQEQLIKDRRKMASRSFLYPLSTCITLPLEGFFLILNGFGIYALGLAIPKVITVGLSGFFTALAFAIDPATHQSFKSAYYQIKYNNSDKKIHDGDFSSNSRDINLNAAQ
ncbi:hypothetical protein CONCODRAFT_2542 [Conidiobolus coronatus NRRL 28638]|uniref:G-protein coupled receptors family 1 profile domain-containing protein n=1 Tax=Conidiobolus coronatus (strain ATCC 28846 / CBS 209.66 / NRRL 28638) TaxID=796925 RepID=A0A137PH74_CONC2|nr:hypothetical protein CONCODRAFT_2542 [Conidiobolus coronatus NRRL 28638]|eukprot:KXN74338.1 hypothetical protein CONCODRAFT_2542 [Conidiobolus coronatus NRRL 28638]